MRARMQRRVARVLAVIGVAVGCGGACGRGLEPAAATGSAAASGTGTGTGVAPLADPAPVVVFTPPGRAPVRVAVEVADTPAARAKGLMDRSVLAPEAGMLFVFERESPVSFWMKDTFIALDMIFIDAGRKVIGVLADVPPRTESSRSPGRPSQFVVEVNAGFAGRAGIVEGTTVEFVGVRGL
jgi:uncharacterized membrane protein (UPF0127 family)